MLLAGFGRSVLVFESVHPLVHPWVPQRKIEGEQRGASLR